MSEWVVFGVAGAVATALLTACGDRGHEPAATPTAQASAGTTSPPQATAYRIMIEGLGYTNLSVPAGALISVVNKDDVEHTVTSDAHGVFDVDLPPHAQAQFRAPSTPGTYPYHCTYHPGMYGELIVT
jgi:plastocyanin